MKSRENHIIYEIYVGYGDRMHLHKCIGIYTYITHIYVIKGEVPQILSAEQKEKERI